MLEASEKSLPEITADPNNKYIIYRKDTGNGVNPGADGFYNFSHYNARFGGTPWDHLRHYATGGFEGILAIKSETNPEIINILTLNEHVMRMFNTMRKMELIDSIDSGTMDPYSRFKEVFPGVELNERPNPVYLKITIPETEENILRTINENLESKAINTEKLIYVRPLFGKDKKYQAINGKPVQIPGLGVESLGHQAFLEVMALNVPPYLAKGSNNLLPRVLVWEDYDFPETGVELPTRHIKHNSNYGFGGIAKNQAVKYGFHETLLQDNRGNAIEGGGENLFIVRDGKLITPPIKKQSILPGTKRQKVLAIASLENIPVEEREIPLEEMFDSGTKAMGFSGTWTGFIPVEYLFQASNMRGKRYDTQNDIVHRIAQVYADIINDRKVEPKFDSLKMDMLTPLWVPNMEKA